MTLRIFRFDDQPDGTTVVLNSSTGNLIADDGARASGAVGTGNTATFSAEQSHLGSRALKVVSGASSTAQIRLPFTAANNIVAFSFYRRAAVGQTVSPLSIRHSSGVIAKLQLDASNRIGWQTTTTPLGAVSTASVVENRWNRYDIVINVSTGTLSARVYNGDATGTPDVEAVTSGHDLGANPVATIELGTPGPAVSATQFFDSVQLNDGATATIGAGTPSTAVQNDTVPLRGTTSDSDGTSSLAWSITSYPATMTGPPTITNPTSGTTGSFVAVAPGTYNVRLTATDDDGATTVANKSVTVTAATGGGDNVEYLVMQGGVLV